MFASSPTVDQDDVFVDLSCRVQNVNCTLSSGGKEFLSLSNNQFTVDVSQVFNPYGNVKDVDILISNRKFLGSVLFCMLTSSGSAASHRRIRFPVCGGDYAHPASRVLPVPPERERFGNPSLPDVVRNAQVPTDPAVRLLLPSSSCGLFP